MEGVLMGEIEPAAERPSASGDHHSNRVVVTLNSARCPMHGQAERNSRKEMARELRMLTTNTSNATTSTFYCCCKSSDPSDSNFLRNI